MKVIVMTVISTWTVAEHRHKDKSKLLIPKRKLLTTSKLTLIKKE